MTTISGNQFLLLHITDFHFGDNLPMNYASGSTTIEQIAKLLIDKISSLNPKRLVIAVGGDIANKADNYFYEDARRFFKLINEAFSAISVHYIICPGNHDINRAAAEKFGDFNTFARALTRSDEFIYSPEHTAMLLEAGGWSFVTANSVFEEKHDRSKINTTQLAEKLRKAKSPIVLLTHHHLIPMYLNDNSCTANAIDTFKTALKYNVKLILHGHVHSAVRIFVGNGDQTIPVVGCGALLPRLSDGYLNQFNLYQLNPDGTHILQPYALTNESGSEVGLTIKEHTLI